MKNVLITGVSRGVGLEMTKKFILLGYNVFGVSRTITDETEELKKEYPNNFTHKILDLSDTDNLISEIKEMIPNSTPIHGFINNAAIAYDDLITNMSLIKLEKMYRVNVFSPMLLTKYVIRNMIFNKIKGSIVHISSISTQTGYKGLSMYASTKGSLEAFSKNISREWGVKGIRSNCLVAGFMETEMSSSLDEELKSKIFNRTSLKKPTSLDSVSNTVEFLISDKSESITGQLINVDSGTI
jgi:3-oxoacyl-[acyl-carrier protein] reductase